jgi:ATP phosphoribosyltransferase
MGALTNISLGQAKSKSALRLILPSDGELHEPTLNFMKACGQAVLRPSPRRYTAYIPALPGVEILFQRAADITKKVEEGNAELGITGLDRYLEFRSDELQVESLIDDLGYGKCKFVLAVPDSWLDVVSLADLADLALEFHQQGKQLRIATKYPRLLRENLFRRGINYFTLVPASGTLEAATAAGYADLIADLSATGTTLRENRLKTLDGGTILVSQACLIGNRSLLSSLQEASRLARVLLEMMEAHLGAEQYFRLTANVSGSSEIEISSSILTRSAITGMRGLTISKISNIENKYWCSVSVLAKKTQLLEAVDELRNCGGVDITASQVNYLFDGISSAYRQLIGE